VTVVAAGATTISPTGIPTAGAVGTPGVTAGPLTASFTGIGSDSTVGAPAVALGPLTASLVGIASAEAFGLLTVLDVGLTTPGRMSPRTTPAPAMTPAANGTATMTPVVAELTAYGEGAYGEGAYGGDAVITMTRRPTAGPGMTGRAARVPAMTGGGG
jgi:hypothetical protein